MKFYKLIIIFFALIAVNASSAIAKPMINDSAAFQKIHMLEEAMEGFLKTNAVDSVKKNAFLILSLDSNNSKAISNLTAIYFKKKDYKSFFAIADRFIFHPQIIPKVKLVILSMALQRFSKMDTLTIDKMIYLAEQFKKYNQQDFMIWQLLGDMYLVVNNLDSAKVNYQVALSKNRMDVNPWVGFMNCLNQKGQLKELLDTARVAYHLFPQKPEIYHWYGFSFAKLERFEEAEKIFLELLELYKGNARKQRDIYDNIIRANRLMKRDSVSMIYIEKAIALDPYDHVFLSNQAYELANKYNDVDNAMRLIQKSISLAPDYIYNQETLAFIYYKSEDYQAALKTILAFLQNSKISKFNQWSANELCGDIYLKLKQVPKAVQYWKIAKQLGSKSKSLDIKIKLNKLAVK